MKKKEPALGFKIDKDKCKGCGLCIKFCPYGNLEFSSQLNARGVKYVQIKSLERCTACGFCFLICPDVCIEIYEQETKTK